MNKVLLVDDDELLCQSLRTYVESFNIEMKTINDGREVTKYLAEVELIILDVMLPGEDGFSICKSLRQQTDIPIIMLTARGDVTDKVVGFEIGADDYMSKPFEPRELIARIQNLLRKNDQLGKTTSRGAEEQYVFRELIVDFSKRRAFLEQKEIDLTSMEFSLLLLLIQNKQKILCRNEILNLLKGVDVDLYTRSIDIMVSRLRCKLNDDKENVKFIKTIWGRGYCFIGD